MELAGAIEIELQHPMTISGVEYKSGDKIPVSLIGEPAAQHLLNIKRAKRVPKKESEGT